LEQNNYVRIIDKTLSSHSQPQIKSNWPWCWLWFSRSQYNYRPCFIPKQEGCAVALASRGKSKTVYRTV